MTPKKVCRQRYYIIGALALFSTNWAVQFYTLFVEPRIISSSHFASNPRSAVKSRPKLIRDKLCLAKLAERLSNRSIVAFDTEFIREKTYFPQLGLIQVADQDDAWLVDPLVLDKKALTPLLEVFADSKILKVAHSAEQDQVCLYHSYGTVAEPLFDTAIGAALSGFGDQISLANLVKKTLGARLPKTHTRADWLRRPLPEVMAAYALADVAHLVEVAELLLAKLDSRGRRCWALEVSALWSDQKRYEMEPHTLAEKLVRGSSLPSRRYAILLHLIRWRENHARSRNIPRKWVADDQMLSKLSSATPKKVEELSHFRGLKVKPDSHAASELLEAIEHALAIPDEELIKPPRRLEPQLHEGPALNVLRCFVNLLAYEQGVAARFLANGDTLLKLLRGRFQHAEELKNSALLPAAVVDHVGDELVAILNGQLGLRLEQGQVQRCTWTKYKP